MSFLRGFFFDEADLILTSRCAFLLDFLFQGLFAAGPDFARDHENERVVNFHQKLDRSGSFARIHLITFSKQLTFYTLKAQQLITSFVPSLLDLAVEISSVVTQN